MDADEWDSRADTINAASRVRRGTLRGLSNFVTLLHKRYWPRSSARHTPTSLLLWNVIPHLNATVMILVAVRVFYDAGVSSYCFTVRDWIESKCGLDAKGAAVPPVVDFILRIREEIYRGCSAKMQLPSNLLV